MSFEAIFQKINDSYDKYIEIVNSANVEIVRKTLREQLIINIFRIYSKESAEYAPDIIEKIDACLIKFEKSSTKAKGEKFSEYVCASIKRLIGELAKKSSFAEKTSGIYISKGALSLMKKVKDLDESYKAFGSYDEEKRNKKIADALEIDVEKVLEMKRLSCMIAESDEQESDDGDTFSLIDVTGKNIDYSSKDKEKQKEILQVIFNCIQEEWEKKSYLELSEILTADILSVFKGKPLERKPEETEYAVSFSSALGFDLEEFIRHYSFINSSMAIRFFSETDYELPSQVELAAKFCKGKSGISKQLSRFYAKVAENEKLKIFKK